MSSPSAANPIATALDVLGAVTPLADELTAARGSAASVDERLDASLDEDGSLLAAPILDEVVQARGTQPSLDDRLDASLNDDGTLKVSAAFGGGIDRDEIDMLRPSAQETPDDTVLVQAGRYASSDGTATVEVASGVADGITFPPVAADPRIDLLCLDDAGAPSRIQGSEAASPSPPGYPTDRQVLAEVTVDETGTVVIDDADIRDVRGFFRLGGAGGPGSTGLIDGDGGDLDMGTSHVITPTHRFHTVSHDTGGVNEPLVTINSVNARDGDMLILRPPAVGDTFDIHTTGNIRVVSRNGDAAEAIELNYKESVAVLIYSAMDDLWQVIWASRQGRDFFASIENYGLVHWTGDGSNNRSIAVTDLRWGTPFSPDYAVIWCYEHTGETGHDYNEDHLIWAWAFQRPPGWADGINGCLYEDAVHQGARHAWGSAADKFIQGVTGGALLLGTDGGLDAGCNKTWHKYRALCLKTPLQGTLWS